MISRRQFLQLSALPWALPSTAQSTSAEPLTLSAAESKAQLLPEKYAKTPVWAYNQTIPGQQIRTQQGKGVKLRFENHLPEPTAVHWHGIRLENAMDGAAGLTQDPVGKGEHFDYHFRTPDAGTYWYHSHHRSWEQMARGLYGALIVEEKRPPRVDIDQVLLIDDWRLQDNGEISNDFGRMMDLSHAGRQGNWLTVNGTGMDSASLSVKRHQRLRLRLVNVANASIFTVKFEGLTGWEIALDGQPLEELNSLEEVTLAPAQRFDVVVDVESDTQAQLLLASRDGDLPIMRFPIEGEIRKANLDTPEPLAPNPLPEIGRLEGVVTTELVMQGGAMGGMRSAVYQGENLDIRTLVKKGMVWAFNGVAGITDTPLLTAKRNERVRIRLVNDTSFPHGIHLHGHHFRETIKTKDAASHSFGPWRDTILLNRGDSKEITFVADNPGKWLLHCHMLGHQAAGMKTWFEVG